MFFILSSSYMSSLRVFASFADFPETVDHRLFGGAVFCVCAFRRRFDLVFLGHRWYGFLQAPHFG